MTNRTAEADSARPTQYPPALATLYAQHIGKVSDKWSNYLASYDLKLSLLRNQKVRLLEIGVQNGGSLELWSKYFSNAESIIGCDKNKACLELEFDDQKIKFIVSDQIITHSQTWAVTPFNGLAGV